MSEEIVLEASSTFLDLCIADVTRSLGRARLSPTVFALMSSRLADAVSKKFAIASNQDESPWGTPWLAEEVVYKPDVTVANMPPAVFVETIHQARNKAVDELTCRIAERLPPGDEAAALAIKRQWWMRETVANGEVTIRCMFAFGLVRDLPDPPVVVEGGE